ncbi:large conductance mechanosensitive channel protein MscL [Thalassiella azotivora]
MIKGFKDFILRGNVIELAVAVVIATAFTAVVTAVTENLINPIIASFGSADVGGFGFRIREGMESTFVDLGAIITAIINFLIIAAVVYFLLILPMNKLAERRKRGQEPEPEAPSEEILLLQEIRDLLAARRDV